MKKPNFFLIGAPKCGTTALSDYLREHPNIFVSWVKEPHYFAEDFKNLRKIKNFEDYVSLFRKTGQNDLAIGEASACYLYSSVALSNIKQFNDRSKIILILRNPVDFLYSYHAQMVSNFFENEENFEVAWRQQLLRTNGLNIPSTCLEPSFLQYAKVARFGDLLERVLTIFPREQIKIILFDDFVKSTRSVYEDILTFLGVPGDGRAEFPKVNQRKQFRIAWIGKLLYHPPFPLNLVEIFLRETLTLLGVNPNHLWRGLMKISSKPISSASPSPAFRYELLKEFSEDIQKLSRLIERDLSHWVSINQ